MTTIPRPAAALAPPSPFPSEGTVYSVSGAARALGIPEMGVRRLIWSGRQELIETCGPQPEDDRAARPEPTAAERGA